MCPVVSQLAVAFPQGAIGNSFGEFCNRDGSVDFIDDDFTGTMGDFLCHFRKDFTSFKARSSKMRFQTVSASRAVAMGAVITMTKNDCYSVCVDIDESSVAAFCREEMNGRKSALR